MLCDMSGAPTTRILTVLELLQGQARIRGTELASRLGVDPRTVRRYIAGLEALGIPIVAERGRDGGYGLVAGFKLPPMMFNNDEALALALGLQAARSLGLAQASPAIASAVSKLERVLPADLKRRVRAVDQTVAIESPGTAPLDDNQTLTLLAAAAQSQQRVTLVYSDAAKDNTTRAFDPYGLGFRNGRWYAVGFCHLRAGPRVFRLDRIASISPTRFAFSRPEGFDVLAYLRDSLARLPRRFQVLLRLHTDLPRARYCVFDTLGVFSARDGAVELSVETDDLDWLARELCRLPFDFQIVHPPQLAESVRSHAQRLMANASR